MTKNCKSWREQGVLRSAVMAGALAGLGCCNLAPPEAPLLAAALPATASPAAAGSSSAPAAIREFLARDVELGAIRDHDPERGPLHLAIARYVAGLDALGSSSSAPLEFLRAMQAHRNAWFFLVEPLRAFAELRGEAHGLFRRLTAPDHPNSRLFQAHLDQVWATWGEVERVATRFHALP